MPTYLITDPDSGRKIRLTGESPPSEDEIIAVFKQASQPKQSSYKDKAEAMASGGLMLSPKAFNTGVRYGTPIAATFMGGPGAGAITTAGLGAAGAFIGELGAQAAEVSRGERESMSAGEVGASTLQGATPFFRGGGIAKDVLKNVPAAVSTYAGSQYMRGGEIDKTGMLIAGSTAGVLTGLGSFGRRITNTRDAAESIGSARKNPLGVLLSEVDPKFTQTEAKLASRGDRIVNEGLDNMDVSLAEIIAKNHPEVNLSKFTSELSQMTGRLEPLRIEAATAQKAVQNAEAQLNELMQRVGPQSRGVVAKAQKEAIDTVRNNAVLKAGVYRNALEKEFGSAGIDLAGISQGARIENATKMVGAADDAAKTNIKALYAEAGIGQNQVVSTKQDISGYLNAASKRGRGLEGKIARARVKSAIYDSLDEDGNITLEGMMELKDNIAKKLVSEGELPGKASRIAAEAYQVVSKGADKYMTRELGPQASLWKRAQSGAAKNFATRETDIVQALREGDSEKFLSAIKATGKRGNAFKQVEDYAESIAMNGNPKAAEAMLNDANRIVRDGVLDSAINRKSGQVALDSINPTTLSQELTELSTKGFNIEKLGLGTLEQNKALARLAAGRKEAGYSLDEVGSFIKDSEVVGIPTAAARLEYSRELVKEAINGGLADIGRTVKKLRGTQARARLDSDEATAALVKAQSNPLVQFLDGTSMKLSRDTANNAKWIDRLLDVDPDTADTFMKTLRASGRGADADILKEAVTNKVLQSTLFYDTDGSARVATNAAHNFFLEPKNSVRRKAVKAVLGDEAYANLESNWGTPIAKIHASRGNIASPDGKTPLETVAAGARGRVNSGDRGAIYTNALSIIDILKAGNYRVAYNLLVNPKYATSAKQFGYDLDKWAASQPNNALLLRLWTQEYNEKRQKAGQ